MLFAQRKQLFHNLHWGQKALEASSAISSWLCSATHPGSVKTPEPCLVRVGARLPARPPHTECLGARRPQQETPPPFPVSGPAELCSFRHHARHFAHPGAGTGSEPARAGAGTGGGAQTARPPACWPPAARWPWGRGWAGGLDPRRAPRPGRRRGAGPRRMNAGCAGSARFSPRSASGGPSTPGSCCASCARREKERASPGLEARERRGTACFVPRPSGLEGAGRQGRPGMAHGPGGFRGEEMTGCRGGSLSGREGKGGRETS